MTVYLVRQNVDNADVTSVHRTLDGAKRAAEQAAGPCRAGKVRAWGPDAYGGHELVETDPKAAPYRDLLYEVTPMEVLD